MTPLILALAVIAGIILAHFIKGVLKAALVVGAVVALLTVATQYTGGLNMRAWFNETMKTGEDLVSEFQPGPPRLEKIEGERFRQQQGWM